ncbi:MAG: outer membrane lipoprotein-sorting protein [Methylobacter sp.]|nr:outer membrane lipoprotein-sorting protein [Methylobacter sp.]
MKILLLALFVSLFSGQSLALTPEEQGLEIITELDKRDTGFADSKVKLDMVLKSRGGDESRRALEISTLELIGEGDKSLTIFDSPRDIKGTAFLSFTHALSPDEQWLFLPALKRVKRISSNNKSGPFLGSDYSFEDLTSFEIARYSYRYLKDEAIDGIDCFVVEMMPQYEFSGYSRQISWIDKQRYIILKTEYYDRKGALLKTQEFKNYKLYSDKYWRAQEQLMTNHQNEKSTQLLWQDYQFGVGLSDRDFDKSTLKRSR